MFESRIYENKDNFIYKTITKKVFKNNDLFKQLSSQFIMNLSRSSLKQYGKQKQEEIIDNYISAFRDTLVRLYDCPLQCILCLRFMKDMMVSDNLCELMVQKVENQILEQIVQLARFRKESRDMQRGRYLLEKYYKEDKQYQIYGHTILVLVLELILEWALRFDG